MKIPSKLKIGGHEWSIKMVEFSDLNDSGDCNTWKHLIRINTDSGVESKMAETLLHEIFEAVNSSNDLKLDHTVLTVLSESLFAVIRNNELDFREDVLKDKKSFECGPDFNPGIDELLKSPGKVELVTSEG